ncbi:MAG: molybdopterin-synthase adenylyltransferase MoeB [Cellvibrionaceae bacterium]
MSKPVSNELSSNEFTSNEWLRYTRHLQLPQVGVAGQLRLKQARVLIVGAGGLGSPVSLYLAAAGVGHISIIDGDTIDLTNLQRQILFTTAQVGQSKAKCAQQQLLALNPDIEVSATEQHLSLDNAQALIEKVDLVIDCTDNFETRYLINDLCVLTKTPWLFASIYQFSGQCALFTPLKTDQSACFRCVFPEKPEAGLADCNTAGVLGVLPGLLGTLQANEAIKYLAGLSCALENTLLLAEAETLEFRKIQLAKNSDCPLCAQKNIELREEDYRLNHADGSLCSLNVKTESGQDLSPEQFLYYREQAGYQVVDVRSKVERGSFNIGGDHIPLDELGVSLSKLDKNKTILCYCQTGIRSGKALALLEAHQFSVKHLDKGLVDLLKSGLLVQ